MFRCEIALFFSINTLLNQPIHSICMAIIVTGSVAAGKTTIAKMIAKKLGWKYLDVTKLIKEEGLAEDYDPERDTSIVDVKKLNKILVKLIKKNNELVIDSHMSHYLDSKYVDLCVVVKCDIETLRERLAERGYDPGKIQENLDAELFDVCLNEALEHGHNVVVVKSPDVDMSFLERIAEK